jgi:hypothetical protein
MQGAAAEGGRRARLHRAWEEILRRTPLRRAQGLEVATARKKIKNQEAPA